MSAIEAAEIVFRVCHQLHGAVGFCDETTLSWLSRYSQPLRRLPLCLSATRDELTRRVGGQRSDGTVRMKVAVIGTGFGKHAAAPAYESLGFDVEVISPRDDSAVQKAMAYDVDLVSVHSPPFMHVDHVTAAIDHGRAVLCDKPFGRSAAEAEAMRDHARGRRSPALPELRVPLQRDLVADSRSWPTPERSARPRI